MISKKQRKKLARFENSSSVWLGTRRPSVCALEVEMIQLVKNVLGSSSTRFKDLTDRECLLSETVGMSVGKERMLLGRADDYMHLSREQVAELLPYLQKFVEVGHLGQR